MSTEQKSDPIPIVNNNNKSIRWVLVKIGNKIKYILKDGDEGYFTDTEDEKPFYHNDQLSQIDKRDPPIKDEPMETE